MAVRVRYDKNIAGLGKIMTSQRMARFLEGEARKGKAFAESIAPIDTGDYKASFRTASSTRGTGKRVDRAVGYLYNDSDHALAVEYQNGNRVLGHTVDAIEHGL